MSQWFRMYNEVLDDPKVQRLSGDDFKSWVNILCLASKNDGAIPCAEDVAFALRADPKKTAALIVRLCSAGLIVTNETGMSPHKWNERQYKSDVSTERVKRFRERSKKPSETATETAPDTDTEQSVPLSNDNGAEPDSDTVFWDNAKSYLGKSRASLVGKWISQHGREATVAAIGAAQINRAVDPVDYIQGYFRKHRAEFQPAVPL